MRNQKKDILELVSYGLLSALFAFAFFFGLLYPEYGMSRSCYRIENEPALTEEEAGDVTMEELDLMKLKELQPKEIRYQSYFWKCLKKI